MLAAIVFLALLALVLLRPRRPASTPPVPETPRRTHSAGSCPDRLGLGAPPPRPPSPPRRARFANPFRRRSPGRRSLANKVKSVFKSPEPPPVFKAIGTRLRRRPAPRTQPYGPPWNAPMPVPDFRPSRRSLHEPAGSSSPSPRTARTCSTYEPCPSGQPLPGQLSPRTFINELDERLSLLEQQRTQHPLANETDQPSHPGQIPHICDNLVTLARRQSEQAQSGRYDSDAM